MDSWEGGVGVTQLPVTDVDSWEGGVGVTQLPVTDVDSWEGGSDVTQLKGQGPGLVFKGQGPGLVNVLWVDEMLNTSYGYV